MAVVTDVILRANDDEPHLVHAHHTETFLLPD